jgi:ABC-2 type transport system ATP-binding protein
MTRADGYAVEVVGLTKRFGDNVAVDNVELHIPRGSAFGYLGPNGAGKTTLIRMLLGLTRADAGSMRLLGYPVPSERGQALARTGAIVEEPRFHRYLTGRDNLRIVAAAREQAAQGRIDGALARVGLSDRADDRVKTYSLGMRQRLGVARALLGDPELLILDEPTNGLDPAGIREFREMIGRLVAEGRTVVLSSHLLDEVEKICDSIAIVDRGRVVMQGTIGELKAGGDESSAVFGVDDAVRAADLLLRHEAVAAADPTDDGLHVRLAPDAVTREAFADINRALVTGGIAVHRLEPAEISLEQRFLEITSRLGADLDPEAARTELDTHA